MSEFSEGQATPTPPPADRFRPQMEVDGPGPQRRLTVLVRALLLIPHAVALFFLGIAAAITVIIGWFCALVMGQLPQWAATYITGFIAWTTRVQAYGMLLTDKYPEFSLEPDVGATRVELHAERLNRWGVLFRVFLLIPAAIVTQVLMMGWGVCAFVIWVIVLITGRTPAPIFEASAAALRLQMRYNSYAYLLTDAYPLVGVMGDGRAEEGAETSGTRPLLLSSTGNILLIVFIVLGAIAFVGSQAANNNLNDDTGVTQTSAVTVVSGSRA